MRHGKVEWAHMSKFPPFWKIRREIIRIFKKTLNPILAGRTFLSYYFSSYYYDLTLSKSVKTHIGSIPKGKKVAIYLIFPSSGVLESHIDSLKYICRSGYSPIVVSNLPLTEAEIERLKRHSSACIERPNFGYDFGGYREAIKFLKYNLSGYDYLAILNDSCWFPVPGSRDWLSDAQALNVDYAGASSNYGFDRPEAVDFKEIKWDYRDSHKNFHYCSFALLISKKILASYGFRTFWKRFPMTGDKTRTVRRGEIGLSQWVIRKGYTHAVTNDVKDLDKVLDSLTTERLSRAVYNLVIPAEKTLVCIKQKMLSSGEMKRSEMIGLILTTVARQGSSYSLADFSIHEQGHSFLKKTPLYLDKDASDVTIRIAQTLPGDEGKTILREALDLRAARAPHFDASPSDAPFGADNQARR